MILRYHGFSSWEVQKLETDNLLTEYTFGFELEVQQGVSTTYCSEMSDILQSEFGNLFVYERDGSVVDGFEIISQPMTWNWFKANISKFKKLFSILNNADYRSHKGNQCGLHIHIGKEGLAFSNCDEVNVEDISENEYLERLGEVVTNINIELERFKDEIFKFSRRKELDCRWCRYLDSSIQLENGMVFIDKDVVRANTKPMIINRNHSHDERYKALNLTNAKTVELRLFRGTLKWSTFYFTMNLMNNLVFHATQESTVIDFNDLVFRGLNNREKSLCKNYCEEREIDMNRNKVLALNVNANKKKVINKRELLNKLMEDD